MHYFPLIVSPVRGEYLIFIGTSLVGENAHEPMEGKTALMAMIAYCTLIVKGFHLRQKRGY